MLCARELLFWLLGCKTVCRYFLKVSNGRALGEYSEKLGFVSLFCVPVLIDEAGAGMRRWVPLGVRGAADAGVCRKLICAVRTLG